MHSFEPNQISTAQLQNYLQSAIAPRPIAFASTIDEKGRPNLAPFSFFNVFSANPPILIFSPAKKVRDNSNKHTLLNAIATKEVVINVVNFEIVQQMSLASSEYAQGVNEFEKAGLTSIPSDIVKPFRVAESPIQFECSVNQVISLGENGGAGNLVICEVLKIHIHENVLDANGNIDQNKVDLVARMGGNFYSRANRGLFEIAKPITNLGIGVDKIPEFIKESGVFDGNDLGKLANIENLPTIEEIAIFVNKNFEIKSVLSTADEEKIQRKAKALIAAEQVEQAWKLLLAKRV